MYRVINELIRPYTFLLIVITLSAAWAWRRRDARWPWRVLIAAVAGLLLMSIPAISYLGFATLEAQTAPIAALPAGTEAMVVLSGGLLPPTSKQSRAIVAEDTMYRCLGAAELYHARAVPVLLTGGVVDPGGVAPPLARVMRDFMLELGAAPDDLLIEDRSTTTYENAVESQRVLKRLGRERIALVTEAVDMPRAAACFRRVGLDVTEAPCHFVTGRFRCELGSFLPSTAAARGSERVVHEWLGILWYWLKGRI